MDGAGNNKCSNGSKPDNSIGLPMCQGHDLTGSARKLIAGFHIGHISFVSSMICNYKHALHRSTHCIFLSWLRKSNTCVARAGPAREVQWENTRQRYLQYFIGLRTENGSKLDLDFKLRTAPDSWSTVHAANVDRHCNGPANLNIFKRCVVVVVAGQPMKCGKSKRNYLTTTLN